MKRFLGGLTPFLAGLALAVMALYTPSPVQAQSSVLSRVAGRFVATNYVGTNTVVGGPYAAGTVNLALSSPTITLPDGRTIVPYTVMAPVTIGSGANAETLTPSAVSGCSVGAAPGACTITVATSNTHGQGDRVVSGTAGLQEAIQDAQTSGSNGGVVVVDPAWTGLGGTTTILIAAVPFAGVTIEDTRFSDVQYWRPTQNVTTALATPAALTSQAACDATHTFCSDASVAGTWTSGTLYGCVSYVDVMGNEGTCSTTANFTSVVSMAIDVGAPAASTGAVGYTVYLSLVGGTYAFAYKVPITSSICTLTKIETITAACAVTNATYGQTGSNAVVAAVTVNTAMLAPNATTISSTTDYVPNPNARTVYKYAPSNRVGLNGIIANSLPFPVGAAAATTVPDVIGTLTLPAGYMNYVGRSIEVCGYATEAANGSTATISNIQAWWDAAGSNAAGVPVLIGTNPSTNTLVTAKTDQFYFCYDFTTTVSGAGVTAGSIQQMGGMYENQYTSSAVATVPVVSIAQGPAAVGSLNLAGEARIDFVWLHTTGTDAAGVLLQNLTVKELN